MEIKDFKGLLALNGAVNSLLKKLNIHAVPFYPMFWGTDQIFYECIYCYKGTSLKEGGIPFYCAYQEYVDNYLSTGSKLTRCINCEFFQQR